MTDRGIVISVHNDLAQVEVGCSDACGHCAVRMLCTGTAVDKKLLQVKNPLHAGPGDRVAIDVPESGYSRALIKIFATLLVAALAGMAAGFFLSRRLSLDSSVSSLAGLLTGLVLGVLSVWHSLKKKHAEALYPVISAILDKGGFDGPS